MSNHFIINQQVFEIDFFSTTKAHELQNRISGIANGDLPVLMNRFFETAVPDTLLYRIDSLVLDVGEVLYDRLEADLPARIMEALEEQLLERFRLARDPSFAQQSGIEVSQAEAGQVQLLEYFLLTGRLPWWAGKEVDVELVLEQLFHHNAPSLRAMLVSAGRSEYVRRRIVERFTGRHMQFIIEVLEPGEATYILEYHTQVVKVQQEEQLIVTEQKAFAKAVWLFILNYLLADRSGEFNRKVFVKSTLMQIAASFNVAYAELLHILYRALHTPQPLESGTITSLEKLVRELASEEEGVMAEEEVIGSALYTSWQVPDAELILSDLDLLRYYLLHGTMPADTGNITPEQLAAVWLMLAEKIPGTLRTVLLATAISREAVQRLFAVLGAVGTRSFLQRVYAERAMHMGAIAATFEALQTENPMVIAGKQVFRDLLWKRILDTVLASRFGITDERVLIHSIIQGIREAFSLPLHQLVEKIGEGIRSGFYKNMRNIEQMGMLQRVVEEYAETILDNDLPLPFALSIDGITEDELPPEEATANENRSLRNLLRFLLSYGSIPWWGREYFNTTPLVLLEKLEKSSPQDVLWLFRFAGTRSATQQRFLAHFPEAVVIRIMQMLPTGVAAVQVWEQLRAIILIIEPDIETQILLQALWEEWVEHDYRFVAELSLYTRTISLVARRYERSPASVTAAMRTVLQGWTGEAVGQMKERIEQAERILLNRETQSPTGTEWVVEEKKIKKKRARITTGRSPDLVLQEHLFSPYAMLVVPRGAGEVDTVREWLAGSEETVRTATTTKLFGMLEQYLATGHLPGSLSSGDRKTANVFIKRLLLLAYHVDERRLASLFEQHKGVLAIAHIAGLITEAAGEDERALAGFLEPVTRIYAYPFNTDAIRALAAGDTQLSVPIGMLLANIAPTAQPAGEEQLVQTAVSLLRYFLLWNRLPDDVKRLLPAQTAETAVLHQLLLWLFHRSPSLVSETIHQTEYQYTALATLHSIAALLPAGEKQAISSVLTNALRESITEAWNPLFVRADQQGILSDADSFTSISPETAEADSRAALLALRMHASELDKRVADALLLDRQAIVIISERKDLSFYETVIERTGYRPFSDYAAVSDGMMQVFDKVFTDTLVREKMKILFKKFNLRLAAEKQRFQHSGEYIFLFFRYIDQYRSPATPVWQQLLGYFESAAESAPPGILPHLATARKGLRVLLRKEEETTMLESEVDAPLFPAGNDPDEAKKQREAEARRREQLREQLAAELERERQRREEEARRKAIENLKEKNARMYIANAGLVLLHPFFGFYFTTLGLLENNAFIDEEKRTRAILLMQYLVTGREKFEEHELVLNKILCGMPLEDPVAVEIEPTQQEKDLSEELFNVMKQRWDKIKNSSVESIRASFLYREGALESIDEGWNLRVEQRGYDMLLQTLPWAFGFIRLPWMTQILTTEWI